MVPCYGRSANQKGATMSTQLGRQTEAVSYSLRAKTLKALYTCFTWPDVIRHNDIYCHFPRGCHTDVNEMRAVAVCYSAWDPDADRRAKLLIYLTLEGDVRAPIHTRGTAEPISGQVAKLNQEIRKCLARQK